MKSTNGFVWDFVCLWHKTFFFEKDGMEKERDEEYVNVYKYI